MKLKDTPLTTQTDQHGHRLTGASAAAREHYERAVGLLRLYSGDPLDRKSTRLNSSHVSESRMPSSA